MLTHLQYRLLKRIAPGEPSQLSGAAYAGKSKLRVLLGDAVLAQLAGKVVIDFGCGEGSEAVELAAVHGAAKVIGIDIRESVLEQARHRALGAGVAAKCSFSTGATEPADAIVCLDSFEHFADPAGVLAAMHRLLKPGGLAAIAFGSTWYHPLGGHLFSVFPWAHLMFSERALIRWRADIRHDGATRFSEVEGGLNQMTIARFERLVRESPFSVERLETVPIRKLRRLHNRLTREFTTALVRCLLRA